MKKSTDSKNKIKFSNSVLGKVLIVLLSVLTVVFIYKDSFVSLNVYSVLAVLLLGSAVSYKAYTYLKNGMQSGALIERLEFPLLLTLIFEIIIEIFGNELFPLSYIILPAIVLSFGWMSGGLSLLIISVLQITRYPSPELPYQIALLFISAAVLGLLVRGEKGRLSSYIFQRDKGKQSPLLGLISGDAYNDE